MTQKTIKFKGKKAKASVYRRAAADNIALTKSAFTKLVKVGRDRIMSHIPDAGGDILPVAVPSQRVAYNSMMQTSI